MAQGLVNMDSPLRPTVIVCYSKADRDFARRLHVAFRAANVDPPLHEHEEQAVFSLVNVGRAEGAIHRLFVVSKSSAASRWLPEAVANVRTDAPEETSSDCFAVIVDETEPAAIIADMQSIEFRNWQDAGLFCHAFHSVLTLVGVAPRFVDDEFVAWYGRHISAVREIAQILTHSHGEIVGALDATQVTPASHRHVIKYVFVEAELMNNLSRLRSIVLDANRHDESGILSDLTQSLTAVVEYAEGPFRRSRSNWEDVGKTDTFARLLQALIATLEGTTAAFETALIATITRAT